jgi:putative transposase
MEIFKAQDDYRFLVTLLRRASIKHAMDIHAYAFMRNHFHLLVTPHETTSVERAMHAVNFRYARYFNDRYQRTGGLFEGRYRTTIVDTAAYWYRCMRYVELNPVRAGIASSPRDCGWTSYAAHAFGAPDPLLTPHPLYLMLGDDPARRQECWYRMCDEQPSIEELTEIRAAVHRGGVLGALVLDDVDPSQRPD